MRGRMGIVSVLGLVFVASGCGPKLAYAPTLPPDPCSATWGCGTNAASLGDGLPFHELDLDGARNDKGVKFVGYTDAKGAPMDFEVDKDRIDATDQAALKGTMVVLENQNGDRFDVKIDDVGKTDYWVHPTGEGLPTYTFKYRPKGGPDQWIPLCNGKEVPADWTARVGVGTELLALVFTGDRYDVKAKTVTTISTPPNTFRPATSRWFNVACAGTALAKMHLLRHTEAGSTASLTTTRDQRQAMLKMLTDDICGTGRSFTRDGMPVYYMDQRDWYPVPPFDPQKARSVEAIWNQDGGICLNVPRRQSELGTAVRAAVTTECIAHHKPDPPPCEQKVTKWNMANWTSVVANWQDWKTQGYGISANR